MKIEEGKKYLTRDGRVVGPMRKSRHADIGYWWEDEHCAWTIDGRWSPHTKDQGSDLVSEYQDPPAKPEPLDMEEERLNDILHRTPAVRVSTPSADTEWIPWAGGECPVHPEAYVEIRWGLNQERKPAWYCQWGPSGTYGSITAYHVLWSPPEEKPKRSGTVWVNVVGLHTGGETYGAYDTRFDADRGAKVISNQRLACVEVEWSEGQGLDHV